MAFRQMRWQKPFLIGIFKSMPVNLHEHKVRKIGGGKTILKRNSDCHFTENKLKKLKKRPDFVKNAF